VELDEDACTEWTTMAQAIGDVARGRPRGRADEPDRERGQRPDQRRPAARLTRERIPPPHLGGIGDHGVVAIRRADRAGPIIESGAHRAPRFPRDAFSTVTGPPSLHTALHMTPPVPLF